MDLSGENNQAPSVRGMGWATLVYRVSVAREGVSSIHPQLEGTADVLVRPSKFGLGLRTWGKAAQKPTKEYRYHQQWV